MPSCTVAWSHRPGATEAAQDPSTSPNVGAPRMEATSIQKKLVHHLPGTDGQTLFPPWASISPAVKYQGLEMATRTISHDGVHMPSAQLFPTLCQGLSRPIPWTEGCTALSHGRKLCPLGLRAEFPAFSSVQPHHLCVPMLGAGNRMLRPTPAFKVLPACPLSPR